MAEIGLAVGGWFVSGIISKIIDVGYRYFEDKLDMKKKLDRINERIPKINSVLDSVDKVDFASSTNRNLKTWFWKIKDVVKSMDAIIDELEYLRIEKLVTRNDRGRCIFRSLKSVGQTLSMSNKLKDVITNLDKLVAEDIDRFCNLVDRNMRQLGHSGRGSLINTKEKNFFGRQKNKDELINWLLDPEVFVQAIVGHGGLGKTALAKHVSDNDRVKEHFADRIWWVVLPIGFNFKLLVTCIYETMFGDKHQTQDQNQMEIDVREKALSRKFLLVFDDVWNDENLDIWSASVNLLKSEESGSKIIVTTRLKSVATKVKDSSDTPFTLQGLEGDHIWTLLCHCANVCHENPEFMRFRDITVKNLKGSPLAARMIGGMLKGGDCQQWKDIMNKLNDGHLDDDIMPSLKLSYEQLPLHLRPLFRYFSIFTPRERFLKKKVVGMWMGAGLLQPKNGETLKDIGYCCFEVLLGKSFIEEEPLSHYEVGLEPFYRMHDLLHNLAEHVSKGEIHRYSDDIARSHEIPDTTRHLSIVTNNTNVFEKVGKLDHLCSLRMMVSNSVSQSSSDADLKCLFSKAITRSIRVFDISEYPESPRSKLLPHIKKMKYLRYIDISRLWVERDIASIFQAFQKLYLLENLIIQCKAFEPLNFHFCKKFDLDIIHDPVAHLEDEELWLLLCKTAEISPENPELQEFRKYMPKLRGSYWIASLYPKSRGVIGRKVVRRIMSRLDKNDFGPTTQKLSFEQL